jgi:hypothetical protein
MALELLFWAPLQTQQLASRLRLVNSLLEVGNWAGPCASHLSNGSLPFLDAENCSTAKSTLQARGCRFVIENDSERSIFGTRLEPDGNRIQMTQAR